MSNDKTLDYRDVIISKWQKWHDENYMESGVNRKQMMYNIIDESCEEVNKRIQSLEKENERLTKELNRKHAEWENQAQTIRNFHAVYMKHFGMNDMACSENLDEKIKDMKSRKQGH